MSLLKTSDLYYSDYKWTAYPEDDPKVTGKPDSTLLNRHEGYEMIYFINRFAKKHKLVAKASGTKIEMMIRTELPSTTRSHQAVTQWLENNWKTSKC